MIPRLHCASVLAVLVICGAAGVASARAQVVPKPGVGSSITPAQTIAPDQRVWLPVFHFRSGFWVNLSHFLYLQARLQRGLSPAGSVNEPAAWKPADLSALSAGERATWLNAVNYYAQNFAGNDLAYDSYFVRVNDRLGQMASCPDLSGKTAINCDAGLAPGLTEVLESAAPIYRAHWWAEQDRVNHAWIAHATVQVRLYAGKPAEMLARTYDLNWPSDPIPVDVTLYAGTFGSYTTFDPFTIVFSSADPRNQGSRALAAVLYQSSYSLAIQAQQEIVAACHQLTKPIPRDLWHALVYYTAAEILDRAISAQGSGERRGTERPAAPSSRQYFEERGWQSYLPLLDRYWQPFLNNQTDMESAIERLVSAL